MTLLVGSPPQLRSPVSNNFAPKKEYLSYRMLIYRWGRSAGCAADPVCNVLHSVQQSCGANLEVAEDR